jgi:DNA-binding GntR family transcriptional regulator
MAPSSSTQGPVPSSHRAYDVLRRAFVQCEVMPGDRVTEPYLAERYDLTRAAVRAALGRLRQQRWISASPRRGYVVRPLTLKDIRNLYAVRMLLEPAAAELAARNATEPQLAHISELAHLATAYDELDYEAMKVFLEANTRFHIAVAASSGNERIALMLEEILAEMERMLHFGISSRNRSIEIVQEHSRLVDALLHRESVAAAEANREQIIASQRMVEVVLLQHPNLENMNLAQTHPQM